MGVSVKPSDARGHRTGEPIRISIPPNFSLSTLDECADLCSYLYQSGATFYCVEHRCDGYPCEYCGHALVTTDAARVKQLVTDERDRMNLVLSREVVRIQSAPYARISIADTFDELDGTSGYMTLTTSRPNRRGLVDCTPLPDPAERVDWIDDALEHVLVRLSPGGKRYSQPVRTSLNWSRARQRQQRRSTFVGAMPYQDAHGSHDGPVVVFPGQTIKAIIAHAREVAGYIQRCREPIEVTPETYSARVERDAFSVTGLMAHEREPFREMMKDWNR